MRRGHHHKNHSKHRSSSNIKDGTDGNSTSQWGSKPHEEFNQFWFCHMCGDGPMTTEIVLACPESSCNHRRCEECTVMLYKFTEPRNLSPSTPPSPEILLQSAFPQSSGQPVVVDLDEYQPSLLVQKSSGSDNSPTQLLANEDNYIDSGSNLARAQGKHGKLPASINQALPIHALPSTTEIFKAASSLALKVVQVTKSTVAVLDPIWTKASIVGVGVTAMATVIINGVNAHTARRVAESNERSAASADRLANATEQSTLVAQSAVEIAAQRLEFDQQESLKKEKEVGKLDATTVKGDGNGEASNSTVQRKKVLPITVSAKPSLTQTRFDDHIRERYKERERKKQEDREKEARNIQNFKKMLNEPFKSLSAAEENELDRILREKRNRHYEPGEGTRESEREDSRCKGKGKERDIGREYSSSSTPGCADRGEERGGDSEEGVQGQGLSTRPSTSTSNLGLGEVGRPSVKGVLRSSLSQPSISPAALPQKLPNVGKQDFYQAESKALLHRSINLAEQEEINLDTLPLSSANENSSSRPDYAVADISLENPSPAEPTALVNKAPASKPGFPPTAINEPSLEVVERPEQGKAELTIETTSGEVPSKDDQDETSSVPPK